MAKKKLTRQQVKQAKVLLRRESHATKPPISPLAESGHKDKANNHAEHTTNEEAAPKGRAEGRRMSGAVLAISGLACCICFAVAAIYWGRGGYANLKIAFPWVVASAIFFVAAVISAFWYYVVKPASVEKEKPTSVRPYVTATGVTLQNLVIGQKPRVVIEYTVGGQIAAGAIKASSRVTLSNEADFQPDYTRLQIVKIDPIVAPPNKMFSTVYASWDVTPQRLDQIRRGKRSIYVNGTIEYANEAGEKFPLYRYCFRYDRQNGTFAFYSPPEVRKIEDYVTPDEGIPVNIDRPKIVVSKIALGDVAVDAHPRYEVRTINISTVEGSPKAAALSFIALMTVPMSETPQYPNIIPEPIDYSPKEEHSGQVVANFTVTDADFAAMKGKRAWLYVYGFVDYTDKAGKPYKTKFCAWYNPDTKKLEICDKHNSAD